MGNTFPQYLQYLQVALPQVSVLLVLLDGPDLRHLDGRVVTAEETLELVGAAILLEVLAGVSVFWALSVGIRV